MRDEVGAVRRACGPSPSRRASRCHAARTGSRWSSRRRRRRSRTRPSRRRRLPPSASTPPSRRGHRRTWTSSTAWRHPRARRLLEELEVQYKNPVNLAFRPDGREVWTACEASASVIVVDVAKRTKVAEIPVGGQATDVAFSPDGSSRLRLQPSRRQRGRRSTWPRGRWCATSRSATSRTGSLIDHAGRTLYVHGHRLRRRVGDRPRLREGDERLATSRYPWSLALSPDGPRMLVTNALSRFVQFRTPPVSEITVLDVAGRRSPTGGWCPRRICCWASPGIRAGSSRWRR